MDNTTMDVFGELLDEEEEQTDEEYLRETCRSVKNMTNRELTAKAKDARQWAEGLTYYVCDPERDESLTLAEVESLNFFMKIVCAVEREAKKRGLKLARWKERDAVVVVLRWLESWVRALRSCNSNVITFPGDSVTSA